MKKILLVVAVVFIVNSVFSQTKFGIKAGVNFALLSDINLGLVNGYKYTTCYACTIKDWKSNVIQAGLGFSF